MAQIFQSILAIDEPLFSIQVSFLDQDDMNFAFNTSVREIDWYVISNRHHTMKRRIKGRYRGLLDITEVPSSPDFFGFRVDFFHRTVHDFMQLKDVQNYLKSHLPPVFSPHRTLCEVLLAKIKKVPVRKSHLTARGVLQSILTGFMFDARRIEVETSQSPVDLIDELEATILHLSEIHSQPSIRYDESGSICKTFLEFAVLSCLRIHIHEK
jgi:hypothetical protein